MQPYSVGCDDGAGVPSFGGGVVSCSTGNPVFYSATAGDAVDSFADGHMLGWLVVAVMLGAWSITILRRGI
jgi:hypothetical protein